MLGGTFPPSVKGHTQLVLHLHTMPSPSKKRKLNDGSKSTALPSRGLEYFFAKQRQTGNNANANVDVTGPSNGSSADQELTDEELARKLQAEWDQEAAATASHDNAGSASSSHGHKPLSSTSQSPYIGDEIDNGARRSETPPHRPAPVKTESKGKGTLSLQSVVASTDTVTESIPFDESPLTFEPSKYLSQLKDLWESEGGNATYALLTRCFVLINSTTSRIKIVDTLVNCLRVLIEGDPGSLLPAVSKSTCLYYNPGVL